MTLAGCLMTRMQGVTRIWVLIVLAVVVAFVVWRLHLFDPVLRHYYRRRQKSEPRRALRDQDVSPAYAESGGDAATSHGLGEGASALGEGDGE